MRSRNIFLLISFLLLTVGLMSFSSAGFLDWFTGRVTTSPTNVSITLTQLAVDSVSSIADQSVTEDSTTAVTFYFTASVPGGDVADINDSSARANFTRAGEDTRENLTCAWIEDIDSDTANYSCVIDVWYFDEAGTWNITAAISDVSDNWALNDSTTFTLQETTAFVASPGALTYPTIVPGATNTTSNNDPSLLNNTGNKPITDGNVEIRAFDLHGETDNSTSIGSSNFTTDTATGGSPPTECDGTALTNATYVGISGATLPKGNHSVNDGSTGQEQLYYCLIEAISALTAQTYSTNHLGSWTIQVS